MPERKNRIGYVLDGRICDYGCGQLANFQFNNGKVCCEHNQASCPFIASKATGIWKKKYGKKESLPQLCECGCGQMAKPGNRFVRGHNTKTEEGKRLVSETTIKKRKRKVLFLGKAFCDNGCGNLAGYVFEKGQLYCSIDLVKCPVIKAKCGVWRKNRISLVLDPNILCNYCNRKTANYQFNNGKVCCEDHVFKCMGNDPKVKIRRSEIFSGENNLFYGKTHSAKTKAGISKKRKGKMKGDENPACQPGVGAKISNAKKGKKRPDSRKRLLKLGKDNPMLQPEAQKRRLENLQSEKTRKKMRITRMKVIQKWLDEGGHANPAYNSEACKFFDQFDIDFNTQGQHATKGGEYPIKELGYWLDYINFDLKLIIEWDEEFHYDRNGNLEKKDVCRQKEIQEHFPDFKFVRIREKFQEGMDYSFMEASRQE